METVYSGSPTGKHAWQWKGYGYNRDNKRKATPTACFVEKVKWDELQCFIIGETILILKAKQK